MNVRAAGAVPERGDIGGLELIPELLTWNDVRTYNVWLIHVQ